MIQVESLGVSEALKVNKIINDNHKRISARLYHIGV